MNAANQVGGMNLRSRTSEKELAINTAESDVTGWLRPTLPIWILTVELLVALSWLTIATCPRWAAMWLLCLAIYTGCKLLTLRSINLANIPCSRLIAYLLGWPGLDAVAFLNPAPLQKSCRPGITEWLFAIGKLLFGAVLFWIVPKTLPADWPLVRGWTAMVGIVFLLHFGLFHLLSCFWRAIGIDAKPLMDWPIISTSVSEFWGRRWNRAFRDLTHRFLFRPLTRLIGPRWGLTAGFLFSGLVHELVITVPAGGGYGGPTQFFALQAAALFAERTPLAHRLGLNRPHSFTGWLFTASVLILPAALLFPPPFVHEIILPMLNALNPRT